MAMLLRKVSFLQQLGLWLQDFSQDPDAAHSPVNLMGKKPDSAFGNYFPSIVIFEIRNFPFWHLFSGGRKLFICNMENHCLKGVGFALHPLHSCECFAPECTQACLGLCARIAVIAFGVIQIEPQLNTEL